MSVHKRKDGIWFAKWRDDHGKERRKYFGKDGEEEARRWDVQKAQAEAKRANGDITLVELASHYFDAKVDDLHPLTRKAIIAYLRDAAATFAEKPCELITKQDLQTLRKNLSHLKPATRNKAQTYLSAIMNWGVEQELIIRNPWAGARKLKEQAYRMTSNLEDFKAIRKEAAPHLAWAIDVSLNLALRPGSVELLSLKWDCFNWKHGYVQIRQGKGGGVKRAQMNPSFLERAKNRYHDDKSKGIPWVVHYKGHKIKSLRTAWRAAKRRAGYQDHPIRLYDIRHIAVSEMLAGGGDPAAVQHQAGHKDLSTTLNIYGHVLEGAQKRAVKLLPDLGNDESGDKR